MNQQEPQTSYDAATYNAIYNGGSYKKGGFFTTYSGRKFNPFDSEAWKLMDIQDIGHALSNMCRFGGHVHRFYSVAQHAVLVSFMCDPSDALAGLLHDATEAYVADIVRPVKETEPFEAYRLLEKKLEADTAKAFGLKTVMPPSVKAADMEAVIFEARNLQSPEPEWVKQYITAHPFTLIHGLQLIPIAWPFRAWSPEEARHHFMNRYNYLRSLGGQETRN